jgi:hypothetical protein
MAKKHITVNELARQLNNIIEMGDGDAWVWFRDWNDCDWAVEEGLYECLLNDPDQYLKYYGNKSIVLG